MSTLKPPPHTYSKHPERDKGLFVQGVGYEEAMLGDMVYRQHGLPIYQFMLFHGPCCVNEGDALLNADEPGFICWAPGSCHHYGLEGAYLTHSWILAKGERFERLLAQAGIEVDRFYPFQDFEAFLFCVEGLYREISGLHQPDETLLENCLKNLFIEIKRSLGRGGEKRLPHFIYNILKEIHKNYIREWSLDELASLGHISKSHLCSSFKEHMGVPPLEYLINLRIREAEMLLSNENLSVADIAEQCGYSSLYYFSRQFKKVNGLSPREYRTQQYDAGRLMKD